MSDLVVPRRLPRALFAAPFVPSAVVAGLLAARFVHVVAWEWDGRVLALVWFATTLPMVLVARGLHQLDKRWRPGPDPEVEAAVKALEKAAEVMLRAEKFMQALNGDSGKDSARSDQE